MSDTSTATKDGMQRPQMVVVALCLIVVVCSIGVIFWILGTGQIRKQGVDALFLVVVCLTFAGAFSFLPFQAMRAAGIPSPGDLLLGPADPEEAVAEAPSDAEHDEGTNRFFSIIWIYLLAMTAVEVVLAYVQLFSVGIMLFILMALSFVKAGLIVGYFMHLKYEKRSLAISIIPATVVVMSLLMIFFPDGFRALALRP
jgi:cytochrome c oxidase subunit IV